MVGIAPIELGLMYGFGALEIGFHLLGFGICSLIVAVGFAPKIINGLGASRAGMLGVLAVGVGVQYPVTTAYGPSILIWIALVFGESMVQPALSTAVGD